MRLDEYIVSIGKVGTRSQAQDLIKRAKVRVGTKIIDKPSFRINDATPPRVQLLEKQKYVSRAGLKLESIVPAFKINFRGAVVLDIGSSTGGFTDYALQNGATTVVAVDVGTNQLDPKLRTSRRVLLFEKTDIRDFVWPAEVTMPDIVVMDLSFVSLTKILPSVANLIGSKTIVVAMAKPQFEAQGFKLNDGVVKNSKDRSQIVSRLEDWFGANGWVVLGKQDSGLAGSKGNVERFYKLIKAKS